MPELNQLGFYACVRNGGEISSEILAGTPEVLGGQRTGFTVIRWPDATHHTVMRTAYGNRRFCRQTREALIRGCREVGDIQSPGLCNLCTKSQLAANQKFATRRVTW